MCKEIAVLITCFNRKLKTIECLDNLLNQDGLDEKFRFSIFLVDDGSTDGTSEAVKNKFPNVNIIYGDGNLYWNRGMHLAWSEAIKSGIKFDYFLWLNDDVVLYDKAILHLLECSNECDHNSIICGILAAERGSSEISYGGGNFINGRYISNFPNQKLKTCEIINGNTVLIPNTVRESIGILDPIFPHSLGDHDFGLRAKNKGFKTYTTKRLIGYCYPNLSLPKWCLTDVSLKERLKALYSPLGNSHPYYYFIFEGRHYGTMTAIKHFITIHIRVLYPQLWLKK